MENSTAMNEAISNQFGAALQMLENAIMMCPEEHWDTSLDFWYRAYHCIFWTDYYLATEPERFEPPAPFTFSEFDPTGKKRDNVYTKATLLSYLDYCRQKASTLIAGLTAEKLNDRWVNEYKNYSLLEMFFYNIRHIQHHAAQLNLLLRQTINQSPKWVSQVTRAGNS
jgi:DinB superfamily